MKKYLVSLMFLAVVCVPVFTSAATVDELLAMIAQLQAQLATLQGNQPPAPTNVCYQFTRSIGVGSRGQDVLRLQRLLIDEGYLQADGPTTYYGAMTRAAVVAFQNANGISPANGVLGAQTRAALNALCVSAFSTSTSPILIVSTTFAEFNYVKGETVPPMISGTVSNNSSSKNLDWKISITNQPRWLNSSYNTESMTLGPLQSAGIGISVDPTNLTPGSYTTKIILSGNFSNSPVEIPITLNVIDPNSLPIPTISYITPTSVNPGATVYVHGKNFNSNTFVALDGAYGPMILPDNAPASGSGVFSFTLPMNTSNGSHTVQVAEKGSSFPLSNIVHLQVGGNATTTRPSITVTSPNGGESFLSSGAINFNGVVNYPAKKLVAYLYSPVNGHVASVNLTNGVIGEFKGAFSGDPGIGVGQYKVNVCDLLTDSPSVPGKPLCDLSDNYFTVVSGVQSKSVSFTAPTGGNMTAGKQVSVSWTGTGFTPNSETGRLYLYNNNGAMVANPYQDYIDKGQTVDGWNLYLAGGSFNPTLRHDLPNGVYQFVMKNLAGVELGRSAHFTVGALAVAQLQVGGPSVSATPIPNGNNPVTAYAVNFTFNLFNIGDLNAYVSKNVVAFLGDSTSGGGQLTGIITTPISGDTATAYVIPAGSSRTFTVNGRLSQVGNSSSESMRIVAVNYGASAGAPTGQSVTAGLEPLSIVKQFAGSVLPPTSAQIEIQPLAANPPTPTAGQNVSIYAPLRNTGSTEATNVQIVWTYDGQPLKTATIASIPANSAFVNRSETSAVVKPAAGSHAIKMTVTTGGQTQETNLTLTVTAAVSQASLDQMAGVLNSLAEIIRSLR